MKASVDWASAFSRTDPTLTIAKFNKMGIRPSLANILIDFLEDRQMSVCFNSEQSSLFSLIGGGPQGSWAGQQCFSVASDDNASFIEQEDRYKFCDDLSILELVLLGNMLTEYNFQEHVASDVGLGERFLPSQGLATQENLNKIALWTKENLMQLKESKTDYLVLTRARDIFATRFTVNDKYIERKEVSKLLGVWLQEDGSYETNTQQLCKQGYARISMLTKLKYAGVSREDLLHLYKQFIRSKLEFCSVLFHSSLTVQQSASLERCQAVCLRVIFGEDFISYSLALEVTALESLSERRLARCLAFSLKCTQDENTSRFFPRNPNLNLTLEARNREEYKVNFCRTKQYKDSAIPFCQRLLNKHMMKLEEEGEERRRQ